MMKSAKRAALGGLLLLWVQNSWAAGLELSLVTFHDFPPFADRALPKGGLSVELVQTVLEDAGIGSTVRFAKAKDGWKDTIAGKYDATFPYRYKPQTADLFFYSQAIELSSIRLFSPHAVRLDYEGVMSLSGHILCHPQGFSTLKVLEDPPSEANITFLTRKSLNSCLRALMSGRADMMALSDSLVWPTALSMWGDEASQKIRHSQPIRRSIRYLIIPKDHPQALEILDRFDDALKRLTRTGALQAIARRHLGVDLIPFHAMPIDKAVPPESTRPRRRHKIKL